MRGKSGPYGTLTLGDAMESPLTYTTGGTGNWTAQWGEGYNDTNAAYAPSLAQGQESWLQTTVEGAGTFSFWAKIDPADAGNELKFYVDDTLRYSCGAAEWEQFSWAVTGAGTHTLKWVYRRNSQSTAGTGYVDDVGWTGALPAVPPPEPAATNWRYLAYTYDASGRRIEKKYDYETITKYVYDGDHCIAEYNAYNQLKRKYIYGPGIDEPICLIDSMTSPPVTSYYHFDALGSAVALTNSSGNTVEVYEYDVYGRVGATDASHPNRILFTGREYDKETGLYYYRARYYNPQIGRFLQTDPVGYGGGMNLYAYCLNSPLSLADSSGREPKLKNEPGTMYDQWTRPVDLKAYKEETGKTGYAHPAVPQGSVSPYYGQWDKMSCGPTAVLNWMLTYNIPLPEAKETDRDAVGWAEGRISPFQNWDLEGTETFKQIQNVVDPDKQDSTILTAGDKGFDFATIVLGNRAVIAGYDLDPSEQGTSWHAILIVPTPADILAEHPGMTISVINGTGESSISGSIQLYDEGGFREWANQQTWLRRALVANPGYTVPR